MQATAQPTNLVFAFLNQIKAAGYMPINYTQIMQSGEKIKQGDEQPIDDFGSLKDLEAKLEASTRRARILRENTRGALRNIAKLVLDNLDTLVVKPGVSLSEEDFRRLAEEKVQSIDKWNDFSDNIFDMTFVNSLNTDMREIYKLTNCVTLSDELRETFANAFLSFHTMLADYQEVARQYHLAKESSDQILTTLGIAKPHGKKKKAPKPETPSPITVDKSLLAPIAQKKIIELSEKGLLVKASTDELLSYASRIIATYINASIEKQSPDYLNLSSVQKKALGDQAIENNQERLRQDFDQVLKLLIEIKKAELSKLGPNDSAPEISKSRPAEQKPIGGWVISVEPGQRIINDKWFRIGWSNATLNAIALTGLLTTGIVALNGAGLAITSASAAVITTGWMILDKIRNGKNHNLNKVDEAQSQYIRGINFNDEELVIKAKKTFDRLYERARRQIDFAIYSGSDLKQQDDINEGLAIMESIQEGLGAAYVNYYNAHPIKNSDGSFRVIEGPGLKQFR